MSAINKFIEKACAAGKKLVLPEGHDPRVVKAANGILERGIAREVIVLGSEEEIAKSCHEAGINPEFTALDYLKCDFFEDYAQQFKEIRAKKGIDIETARKAVSDRIFFGAMMTRNGMVDGLVAGSIASTPDMLRASFNCIGTAPGIKIGSSCFVMDLATPTAAGDEVLLYADCGVNPNPDADQLVDIALATSDTYRSLMGKTPKVAFLSFSTFGSAKHELLDKVVEATAKFKARIAAEGLDIIADGELQSDAALVPSVAKSKAPESAIQGDANVLIFPDLNAGNIAYKLTQRLAGAGAYGPILQGLARPINDLSRGCSAEDIIGVAAITVCQSI
ncbi:phosphate acetyltransferase [Lentisphaerota bacterium ZTH]|nr:phosphate acetyltransferase [Lentisphaerota bacterium]WET06819.1 phosphate acetyltransferase [Lentisphaerota bacterium ZTH]